MFDILRIMSSIEKWAEQSAASVGVKGRRIHVEDDFESELVLPDGPLQLHIRPKTSTSQHSRSESASESSTSGSQLFSDSEHSSKRTDIDNDEDDGNGDDDDDDERSNTLKANQLPDSFAAQLALSKRQAAMTKQQQQQHITVDATQHAGKVHHLGSKTISSPEQSMEWCEDIDGLRDGNLTLPRTVVRKASFASHISDPDDEECSAPSSRLHSESIAQDSHVKSGGDGENDDIESYFELPESVQKVQLSLSAFARRKASATELQRIPSPALAASKSSSGSTRSSRLTNSAAAKESSASSRLHTRTATSMSHTSSGKRSSEGDGDFFDDIELPPSFGKQGANSVNFHPGVDSSVMEVNLQAMLREKMAGKVLASQAPEGRASLQPSASVSGANASGSQAKAVSVSKSVSHSGRYREKPSDSFEDGFIFEDQPQTIHTRAKAHDGQARLGLGSSSPPSQGRFLTSAGRPSLKPSRRSNVALQAASDGTSPQASLPRSASYSQGSDRGHALRSKPSVSNLSARTASPGPSLSRRKSSACLNVAISTDSTPRPASPAYAQPTRSFLARQHSGPVDSFQSFTGASLSNQLHLRAGLGGNSRPGTPQSPGLASTFSRLAQPTVASRAKSRSLPSAASDPSGRSSASLGQPMPLTGSMSISALPLTRNLRRPSSLRKTQHFFDGSELDAFDDLPVNREKEKRFVKAPRRRQSSGAATDVVPELKAKEKAVPGKLQRDRMDSAPMKMQHIKRRGQNASGGSTTSTVVDHHARAARVITVESKRPKLQLIKGLNAAKLSKGKLQICSRLLRRLLRCLSSTRRDEVEPGPNEMGGQ